MENTLVLVKSKGMGKADEELQQLLFGKYVERLVQAGIVGGIDDIIEIQTRAHKVITT